MSEPTLPAEIERFLADVRTVLLIQERHHPDDPLIKLTIRWRRYDGGTGLAESAFPGPARKRRPVNGVQR